jgi:hypothetical protein
LDGIPPDLFIQTVDPYLGRLDPHGRFAAVSTGIVHFFSSGHGTHWFVPIFEWLQLDVHINDEFVAPKAIMI